MTNPFLAANRSSGRHLRGSPILGAGGGQVTHLARLARAGAWWNAALLFWDDFSADGQLGPGRRQQRHRGLAVLPDTRDPPRGKADVHLPARLAFPQPHPRTLRLAAPKGDEKTVIGNHYSTRFADAWAGGRVRGRESRPREKRRALRRRHARHHPARAR